MNFALPNTAGKTPDVRVDQIVKLATLAVGGQGGGVLNEWIVSLAESNGFDVQATSVAGVAQRTGATIYYVEMLPKSGQAPVFSLAPSRGDVDIVLAAELMEAGRALIRGLVTPSRTKVIASTHRQLAVNEKIIPGNGVTNADAVMASLRERSEELIVFNMQKIADEEGTVISAAMFGALAGSGTLPFDVGSYRETIRGSGRGVDASLAAFDRAYEQAQCSEGPGHDANLSEKNKPVTAEHGPRELLREWEKLEQRVAKLPAPARKTAIAGMRKAAEFQDLDYGRDYLERLEALALADGKHGGEKRDFAFTCNGAKYLANAMVYDDVIRVADAKTRTGRFARIAKEVGAGDASIIRVTEYTHPGASELVSLLPAKLGIWVERRARLMRLIDFLFNRGRHTRTDRIGGFLQLYLLAGMRRWRRSLLRHQREWHHIEAWLEKAVGRLQEDYDLAVETLCTRRLIKGYSDTHARGLSKFDMVMEGADLVEGRSDAADWVRRLIDAALMDETGDALEGALKTIKSFREEFANG